MIKDMLLTTKNIIEGTKPYQVFVKDLNNRSDYSTEDKQVFRLLVNGLLNRYYRYYYSLTSGKETDLTLLEVLGLALYSFNIEKKITSISYNDFLSALPTSAQVKIEERYPATAFPIYIPQTLQDESLALSYAARFSAPLSLVETLINDVGKKNILRFLASRPVDSSGIVNTGLIDNDAFFTREKEFTRAENNVFYYHGRDYIKKTKPYLHNEIIIGSQSLLDINVLIGEHKVESLLFIQKEDTSLLLLLALTHPEMQIDFFAEDPKARFIVQHLIKKFNLVNVNYITAITKVYPFVVTALNGSNINGNIRHRDFYYRLNEDLDTYAASASADLLFAKDYVLTNGQLLFMTTTALRSETHYQALSFIRDNPDFTLIREKQQYHFNKHHETVYFALFNRGVNGV